MQLNLGGTTTLTYHVQGEGETILFIPGILGSLKTYEPVVKLLEDRYRCVTIELASQGSTTFNERVEPEHFSVDQHSDDVCQLIEHLQIDSCHIVGLSYGSQVAINIASRLPDIINDVILLAVLLPNKTHHYQNWNKLWDLCSYDLNQFTRIGMGLLFSEGFLNSFDDPFTSIKALYEPLTDEHMRAFRMNLASASKFDVQSHFEKLQNPTLCIHGEVDAIHPLTELQNYLDTVGKPVSTIILPAKGHGIHAEAPDEIAREISDWLTNE